VPPIAPQDALQRPAPRGWMAVGGGGVELLKTAAEPGGGIAKDPPARASMQAYEGR